MPGLYGILNTGRIALLAQQQGLDVTGNNIANVNTPGYTRQRVNLESSQPISSYSGQMGTGVKAAEIQRIYDRFLGSQINNQNQNMGRWEAQQGALGKAEIIFNESSGYGLNQFMSAFWNSWQDLANNPAGHVERVEVLSKSEVLATTFNQMASELIQAQNDLDVSIKGTVEEINTISRQLADLNQKISQVEVSGQHANTYRDQRDMLLKDLSNLIDINTYENDQGLMAVFTGGGRPLVENLSSWDLSTATNADGHLDVTWIDSDGNATDITADLSGGKLKGWLEARDVNIADYLTRLDDLAAGIINGVNSLHAGGFDLNNIAGQALFTGTTALDMGVNQNILDDPNLVAAAANFGDAPGDNTNALAIADLQAALTMSGASATFDTYYTSIVSDAGSAARTAAYNFDHQTSMATLLDNYRETVSGVSLDEEMVNLIQFQHAYQAAAKLIATVDEILDTVLNM